MIQTKVRTLRVLQRFTDQEHCVFQNIKNGNKRIHCHFYTHIETTLLRLLPAPPLRFQREI
jgi:hypothetical protein